MLDFDKPIERRVTILANQIFEMVSSDASVVSMETCRRLAQSWVTCEDRAYFRGRHKEIEKLRRLMEDVWAEGSSM
jgi:hypothetical protein